MEGDFAYPVGKFSKFVVKYPVVVMFASFFVSVALSASLMASDSVKLLGAWSDDSSPIVRGLKGFEQEVEPKAFKTITHCFDRKWQNIGQSFTN